jgi:hypothetical protein
MKRLNTLAALGVAGLITFPAFADFLGLVVDSFPANEAGLTVHDVYAEFDDAQEMVVTVSANSLSDIFIYAHDGSGTPRPFHQEPICGNIPGTAYFWEYFHEARRDTFVSIGQHYHQGDDDTTMLLPGFDSAAFNNAGSEGGGPTGGPIPPGAGVLWADSSHGGWLNRRFDDPDNDGIAGADGVVLIMRLVVDDDTHVTGSGGLVHAIWEPTTPTLHDAVWYLSATPLEPCPADVNGDFAVDVLDLLAVIAAWGNHGGAEDINNDGIVDVLDLLAVIAAWGSCPE